MLARNQPSCYYWGMNADGSIDELKRPFQKREWILLLVVLGIVQLLVHCIAWRFAGSTNALGYVSFAGTIISIILAVLAIIYGFVQTTEQTRSTSTIGAHITSLYRVVESFQKSAGMLTELLEQLSNMSAGINRTVTISEKSHEQITRIQSAVDEVKELVGSAGMSGPLSKEGESSDAGSLVEPKAIGAYMRVGVILPMLVAFSVSVASRKGEKHLKGIQHLFVNVYYDVVHPGKEIDKVLEAYLAGYIAGVVRALPQFFGALAGDGVEIVAAFEEPLRQTISQARLKEENWEMVRTRLIQIDAEESLPVRAAKVKEK